MDGAVITKGNPLAPISKSTYGDLRLHFYFARGLFADVSNRISMLKPSHWKSDPDAVRGRKD